MKTLIETRPNATVAIMLLLAWPAVVQAQFSYTTNNGTITITAYTASDAVVTIPGSIDGWPVTEVGSVAFEGNTYLTSVIFPDSVTWLARDAFSGCTRLSSVSIGSGLTNISPAQVGWGIPSAFPFFRCFSLTNIAVNPQNPAFSGLDGVMFSKAQDRLITYPPGKRGGYVVPASVTSIEDYAFRECFALQSVIIASTVTNIGEFAFFGCASLTNVDIPHGVTGIGGEAFSRCGALARVGIPSSVTNLVASFRDCTRLKSVAFNGRAVGDAAFYGCTGLKEVVFGSGVTSIGNSTFFGCAGLTNVILGQNVTNIGGFAFAECIALAAITIPSNVTSIGSQAFITCTNLTSVTIPESVTNIGGGAFENCTSLTNITVDPQNPAFSSLDGVLFNKSQDSLIQYPAGKGGDYIVPESVTNISSFAFAFCGSLTNVTLPTRVTVLERYSFLLCRDLRNVTIPDSVTSIGGGAFQASGLTSVIIPPSVTNIWSDSFVSCTNLTNITVSSLNPAYSSLDGVLFNKFQTWLLTIPAGKAGGYTIPNGVTNIGSGFYYEHARLTSLAIPSSVTTPFFDYEFQGCTGLTNITVDPQNPSYSSLGGVLFDKEQRRLLKYPPAKSGGYTMPNTVSDIGPVAFGNSVGLTSIVMSDNLTGIASDSFLGCAALTSVTIPQSVTNLQAGAFIGCTSLTNFAVEPLNLAYASVDGVLFSKSQDMLLAYPPGRRGGYVVPEGVTRIGYLAFFVCSELTSVAMPNSVTSVEADSFFRCSSLTNVVIGNGVTDLPASAFDGCTALQSLFFGGDVPTWYWDYLIFGLNGTVYYLPGALGWGVTFGPLSTRLWNPQIQTDDGGFGLRAEGFSFNIAGTPDIPFVIEASSSLTAGGWAPLQTLTLTNGLVAFTDSAWVNWPSRFYRLRSP